MGTALIVASQQGHTEIVKILMARPDIDVNKALTSDGRTALIVASQKGHTEIVEKLMARPDIGVNKALNQQRAHGPHHGEPEGPHRDRRAAGPPRHRRQQGRRMNTGTQLSSGRVRRATPRSSRS